MDEGEKKKGRRNNSTDYPTLQGKSVGRSSTRMDHFKRINENDGGEAGSGVERSFLNMRRHTEVLERTTCFEGKRKMAR